MKTTRTSAASLRIRVVDDEVGLRELEAGWNALADQAGGSVFMRHEWHSAAWAWRRLDAELFIVCAYTHEGALVGLLPLIRPRSGSVGGRVLEFLAVPDAQWCDVQAEPAWAGLAGEALAHALLECASQWDVLRLDRLAPDSLLQRFLLPALKACDATWRLEADDCNLYVDLSGSWDDYHRERSRKLRKAFNLAANRLARIGGVEVEQVDFRERDIRRVHASFEDAVDVSRRSWKHATSTGLEYPGPLAFMRQLTDVAFAQGWLSLWLLRINGQAVAMEYQLVHRRCAYALRADFDESYQHASPGTYLNREIIRRLFDGAHDRYYLGPGRNAYKKVWSVTGEPVYSAAVFAPTARGRALALWSGVKPTLRMLRNRIAAGRPGPSRDDPLA